MSAMSATNGEIPTAVGATQDDSGPEANNPMKAAKVSDLDGSAPDSTDFANYFCAYGYIYHQV